MSIFKKSKKITHDLYNGEPAQNVMERIWKLLLYPTLETYRDNMRVFSYIKEHIEQNKLKVVKSGEIEVPPIVYHQEGPNIKEMEDFWND